MLIDSDYSSASPPCLTDVEHVAISRFHAYTYTTFDIPGGPRFKWNTCPISRIFTFVDEEDGGKGSGGDVA